ncbi:MAG: phospho-sugar mutase [Clostridiales bacterium]|nr:phospho-sugar mutase [Candidatus Crickella merdequi]
MNNNYRANYTEWLDSILVDRKTKDELRALAGNDNELKDQFEKMLSFGTSGLRGLMRAGLNGMNVYTVRYATQGLAALITSEGRAADGVVLTYDSRNNSRQFAQAAAEVLAGNGVKVFFFESLRPTPELSFAVRELNAVAGVNITASHNPKEYNGYKVYWDDGAQIAPDKAAEVAAEIEKLHIFDDVKLHGFEDAVKEGLITVIGREVDESYIEAVLAQSLAGDYVSDTADDVRIVYSAFHGAGFRLVPEVLERIGIRNLIPVREQLVIDGNFPTVPTPNPEFATNYDLAIKYAERENADIIIGTDPDSDRCGAVVRTQSGYKALTGNQMGILMLDYILERRSQLGTLPSNAIALKSVVSSSLCERICSAYGISCGETLTGFKYIGEKIKQYEASGEYSFVFGFEESIGFLTGTYTRDKDAVLAAMLMSEITCFYKSKGLSVYEGLQSLYNKYGFCLEMSDRIDFGGFGVQDRMAAVMTHLRGNIPSEFGLRVTGVKDYLNGYDGFNPTDMLCFQLEDDCQIILRTSGTEPVIKVYTKTTGATEGEAANRYSDIMNVCRQLIDDICHITGSC